jgi:hypothetical protein
MCGNADQNVQRSTSNFQRPSRSTSECARIKPFPHTNLDHSGVIKVEKQTTRVIMKKSPSKPPTTTARSGRPSRLPWIIMAAALGAVLLVILSSRKGKSSASLSVAPTPSGWLLKSRAGVPPALRARQREQAVSCADVFSRAPVNREILKLQEWEFIRENSCPPSSHAPLEA